MGTHYNQLTLDERCDIAGLRRAGQSIRQIAAALDRAPSSISRELKRNGASQPVGERRPAGSQPAGYRPAFAHQQARARRWSGSRLDRDPVLRGVRSWMERLFPHAPVTCTAAGHFLQEEVPREIAEAISSVAGKLDAAG